MGCGLTPAHKLQGRGSFDKSIPATAWLFMGRRKTTAAPCQVEAVVRPPP